MSFCPLTLPQRPQAKLGLEGRGEPGGTPKTRPQEGGQSLVVEHFSEDLLDGPRGTWSADGVLMSQGDFRAGAGVGVHEEWAAEGALVMRRTHDDPPGADREERWWPSGQLRSRGLFVGGWRV